MTVKISMKNARGQEAAPSSASSRHAVAMSGTAGGTFANHVCASATSARLGDVTPVPQMVRQVDRGSELEQPCALCGSYAPEPIMTVNCHCRDCQRATGTAYASGVFVPVVTPTLGRYATRLGASMRSALVFVPA